MIICDDYQSIGWSKMGSSIQIHTNLYSASEQEQNQKESTVLYILITEVVRGNLDISVKQITKGV